MEPLHVEVVQKKTSLASKSFVEDLVRSYLSEQQGDALKPGTIITGSSLAGEGQTELGQHVESISLCEVWRPDGAAEEREEAVTAERELVVHVYTLNTFGAERDTMTDAATGEETTTADAWALPAEEFHGLWESLVYDSGLKEELLRLAETGFEFGERGVDPNVVAWNRTVLLHGPPGTGKTSLCRALAQKLAVRLGGRFPRARLLEIDTHGLFSRWFSESGKLVGRLFERVRSIAEDRRTLTVVLVDEVESLAHARRAALAGLEPSDALRAVNALLTQLDRLRRYGNALVLATSNVPSAVDPAFVDRADVKRRVGPPSVRAAHEILRGCCAELTARGAVAELERPLASLEAEALWAVARAAAAAGVSARALRRLPFLARAQSSNRRPPSLRSFLRELQAALDQYVADEAELAADGLPSAPRPAALGPAST